MSSNVHRFVSIEQTVRDSQPEAIDLKGLFEVWGLTRATQESLWVIALDNIENVKTITEVAKGSFHDVVAHIPTILAAALTAQTDRFYIAHNHPSGPVRPTEEDMDMTRRVMAAANVAGMAFEDHIITGPEGWYSFFDEGILTRSDAYGIVANMKKRRKR